MEKQSKNSWTHFFFTRLNFCSSPWYQRSNYAGFLMAFEDTKIIIIIIIAIIKKVDQCLYLGNRLSYGCLALRYQRMVFFLPSFKILLCGVYVAFFLVRVLYLNKSSMNGVLLTFIMTQGKNTLRNGSLTKLN